ncbi:helix-turn-helix domain-containing protein [Daejeonella sp.]|jgi:AraC-like DNA-binding protein|uniref:helix-turn-helix domain-containing protein n=1 Tax=Daejeonella sp. TaxID=2805397 RepID=UPI003784CFEA
MLFYSWCALAYLLIVSGWIIEIPFFYKTAAPINFLIPPLGYFYVRSVLRNESRFEKSDLWHFLPFLIFVINYLPVYTMATSDKINLLQNVINKAIQAPETKQGFLPEYVDHLSRIIQSIVYLVFQWRLLTGFTKKLISPKYEIHTLHVLRWLKIFNWSFSLVLFSTISSYLFIFTIPNSTHLELILLICTLLIAIGYLVLSSFLLLNPEVLFGLPYAPTKHSDQTLVKEKELKINSNKEYEKEIKLLENYFKEKNPYLNNTLNINEVAIGIGIPARELSFILNQHFNQRFTDFVNGYRVQYVIEQIKHGFCDRYTIETLSKQAGFTSKSTFNAAFKKLVNLTPSKYIERETNSL